MQLVKMDGAEDPQSMAKFDLTTNMGQCLDRHLVFPLLEFLTVKGVCHLAPVLSVKLLLIFNLIYYRSICICLRGLCNPKGGLGRKNHLILGSKTSETLFSIWSKSNFYFKDCLAD